MNDDNSSSFLARLTRRHADAATGVFLRFGSVLAGLNPMRAAYWLAGWIVLSIMWTLIAGTARWSELAAGLAAAALAATGAEVVRSEERPRFFPHIGWLFEFRRIPLRILLDCWILIRHLLRGLPEGCFSRVEFDAGGGGARAVARRVLAVTYTTLPPNSLVVGIDRQRNFMLIHQIEPEPPPEYLRRLEAQ